MPTVITGTDGINQVQAGAVESGDLPAGSVIQVVSKTKSDVLISTSSSWTDVTDLSASIIPKSTSNKIFVSVLLSANADQSTTNAAARLNRNENPIAVGDLLGNRSQVSFGFDLNDMDLAPHAHPVTFLDTPATVSLVTYKMQIKILGGGGEMVINRSLSSSDSNNRSTAISTITLMEIAG